MIESTPRVYTKSDPSLPKGISQQGNRFVVRVSQNSQRVLLGQYTSREEAVRVLEAYQEKSEKPSRNCKNCNKKFCMINTKQIFCCQSCKGQWKFTSGEVTTQSQYDLISGNWSRYCSRLLYVAGRKRAELTKEDLLSLLEKQHYKCALSGIPLTCQLTVGKKVWTNASIDRLVAGGPYVKENIQLVCSAVNSWRSNTPLEDFIEVCRKIAEQNPREIGG